MILCVWIMHGAVLQNILSFVTKLRQIHIPKFETSVINGKNSLEYCVTSKDFEKEINEEIMDNEGICTISYRFRIYFLYYFIILMYNSYLSLIL